MISFAFTGGLQSGPSGTVGDFSFGLLPDREISVANYSPAPAGDLFIDAIRNTISGLSIPHVLDDLRFIPAGNVCRVEGKGGLKFTASVQYNFLNNTLATPPFETFPNALTLKLRSGPKLQVAVEHTNTRRLTIAASGNNKVRTEESFDFSIGVSANMGSSAALPFLVEQLSMTPDKDLQQLRSLLRVNLWIFRAPAVPLSNTFSKAG